MAFILFGSIHGWIQSLCRGAKQRLRQWTRPGNSNDSLAVGTAVLAEYSHPFQPSLAFPAVTYRGLILDG
jgi:hypothetical protein